METQESLSLYEKESNLLSQNVPETELYPASETTACMTNSVESPLVSSKTTNNHEYALVEDEQAKVFELLRILEEFRTRSEESGNYTEAARTHKQLNVLRKQEEKRQLGAVAAKHEAERADLLAAHQQQLDEFNAAWNNYMSDYENLAAQYVQQLTDRHIADMAAADSELQETLIVKPPRFSKELIDQRRRQHAAARSHHYREAQQLKRACDLMEEAELGLIHQDRGATVSHRQSKLRKQHQVELQALLARIDGRRAEHVKKRAADHKRLAQRNRNIQAALESRQTVEAQRLAEETRKSLQLACEPPVGGAPSSVTTSAALQSSSGGGVGGIGAGRRIHSSSSSGSTARGSTVNSLLSSPVARASHPRGNGSARGTSPRVAPANNKALARQPTENDQGASNASIKASHTADNAAKSLLQPGVVASTPLKTVENRMASLSLADYDRSDHTTTLLLQRPLSRQTSDLSFLSDAGPSLVDDT